ncbi:hypothetical protein [Thermomonospora cellulosilytica]|uniref:MalT-like TPR region domain-containing protein n=1 Tax=Thermomonospora cellulosilytica TaxID=1411118 RepID=A0A7W3N486_9ACTN|nr:hypothetical protein [Thermomonospora cellulosilytica]MBA9007269.1 hypothetical protein [Thermomonospora cellulosilytica]
MYLHARSLVLLADARRDQGKLIGPLSAVHACQRALSLFTELDNPRRVAQTQLALAVGTEMNGDLHEAARRYQALASGERLSGRDRARSRLWIGTVLSKAGEHEYAARVMLEAVRELEDLGETEDWATAQQKLALACRGIGALDQAFTSSTSPAAAAPWKRRCSAFGSTPYTLTSCCRTKRPATMGCACSTRPPRRP